MRIVLNLTLKIFNYKSNYVYNVIKSSIIYGNNVFFMNNRLKKIINNIGISQKEFAEKIGVKSAFISDIINERAKGFSSETLTKIVKEFNININWLLTGEGEMFLMPSTYEKKKGYEMACGDPRIKKISRLLADNPEMITITDKFLSGSATLKELVEAAEGLPEKRRKVALLQIKALESC